MTKLSDRDLEIVNVAGQLLCEGDIIEGDDEFQTVVGFTRLELAALLPLTLPLDKKSIYLALGILADVTGYPHGKPEYVEKRTGCSIDQIRTVASKIRSMKTAES